MYFAYSKNSLPKQTLRTMKQIKMFFWAQSLDNQSPDFIYEREKKIPETDRKKRRDIVKRISEVTAEGRVLYDRQNVTIQVLENESVLTVRGTERDVAGRAAPVTCLAKIPSQADQIRRVVAEVKTFFENIGRNIPRDTITAIADGLGEAAKKKQKRQIARTAAAAILSLLGLWAAYEIIRWIWSDPDSI